MPVNVTSARPTSRSTIGRRNVQNDGNARGTCHMTVTRRTVVTGLAVSLWPVNTRAQARPVRFVVPFAPGGGADLIARLVQPHLQQILGQPFIVENRAGAAGRIGTDAVAKADPDGHTLLMTTESSLVIAPHIGVPMNYDPLKDFAPVSLLTRNAVVL